MPQARSARRRNRLYVELRGVPAEGVMEETAASFVGGLCRQGEPSPPPPGEQWSRICEGEEV